MNASAYHWEGLGVPQKLTSKSRIVYPNNGAGIEGKTKKGKKVDNSNKLKNNFLKVNGVEIF